MQTLAAEVPNTLPFVCDVADAETLQRTLADIASGCYHVVHQPQSAWTLDLVIRPCGEEW
ncbi:MAG: hypothetical protein HRT77_06545 [Halioglobus sp.]|nr:hypothetical protein [Halioglobus sp.]